MATYKEYLEKQSNHLELISALSCFVNAVREFKPGLSNPRVEDMLEYFDLMDSGNFSLSNTYKIRTGEQGVELLTAHSAKGLEFDHVYVVKCDQKTWHKRQGSSNKIGSPLNVAALPDKDSQDDSLRLFYVALTRARQRLVLTKHDRDSNGKELDSMACLENIITFERAKDASNQDTADLSDFKIKSSVYFKPISVTKKDYFAPVLEDYKMSVTHLNNFLDVTGEGDQRKGPRYFYEINLLRFPQNKTPNGCYGTAMHEAVANIHRYYKIKGYLPPLEQVLESFAVSLLMQRMHREDYKKWLDKGTLSLTKYYNFNKHRFERFAILEYSFATQNVVLDEARMTGNIDKLVEHRQSSTISVTDFKTGKSQKSWSGRDVGSKVKMFRYQKQLEFYKLLVENSARYRGIYTVDTGYLEFLDHDEQDSQTTILELALTDRQISNDLRSMINIVWQKIMNLDFPDTSNYSNNLDGILHFMEDLKSGRA